MKVILLQEVKGKGGEGDVIDVTRGFANNYLFTHNIAVPATKGNLKQLEQRKHNIAKREETRIGDATKMKETLEGLVVKVDAKVGEEGQLFGSVTSVMVAEAIKNAIGVEVDKRDIDLGHTIKTAGEHEAVVSLYRGTKSTIKLMVGDAKAAAAAEEAAAEETVEVTEVVVEEVAVEAEEAAE